MTITGDSKFGPFGVSSDLAEIIALDTDHNQVSIGTKWLKFYSGVIGTETLRIMDIASDYIHMSSGAGSYSDYELGEFTITNDNQKAWIKGNYNEIQFGDNRTSDKMLTKYMVNGITFTGVSSFDIGTNLTINENIMIDNDGISQKNSSGKWVTNIEILNPSNNFELGYGGYNNKIGATNIYGNNIQLLTRGNITSNRQLKYLWTGAHFMNANQTATLNDKISNQLNGIVLVWSKYSNGAQNYEWNCFFIPKQIVTEQPGGGHAMYCIGLWPSYKYVYINQTNITGSTANESKNNKINGVTVDSTNHVLRYVIGV